MSKAEHSAESDARPSWVEKHYTEPCASCGARVGQPCRTGSGYVTMRHAARRGSARSWETEPHSGICRTCGTASDWADSCSAGCVIPPAGTGAEAHVDLDRSLDLYDKQPGIENTVIPPDEG